MSHRRVELRRVLPKEAVTCAQGLAALTPTAEGSPTPIVPDGPEFTPWPGTGSGSTDGSVQIFTAR